MVLLINFTQYDKYRNDIEAELTKDSSYKNCFHKHI
jgi:hypothetical protein